MSSRAEVSEELCQPTWRCTAVAKCLCDAEAGDLRVLGLLAGGVHLLPHAPHCTPDWRIGKLWAGHSSFPNLFASVRIPSLQVQRWRSIQGLHTHRIALGPGAHIAT